MPNPIYPNLQGQTYPIVRRYIFSTIVNKASSGLEVRVGNYSQPIIEWDIPYSWLSQEAAIQDFQALVNAFNAAYGQLGVLTFDDPDNNSTEDALETIGEGDGVTKDFSLSGRIPKVVTQVLPPGATVNDTGVHYAFPPGVGVSVQINFTYTYTVRFATDDQEFVNFVQNWWEVKKVTLRQVRA